MNFPRFTNFEVWLLEGLCRIGLAAAWIALRINVENMRKHGNGNG